MGQQVMIPIFEGAYLRGSDIGSSYPVNMRIETQPTGVDDFYLATEHGLLSAGTLEAPASGACYWGGFVYVIAGSTFYKIDSLGNKTVLATGVQGSGLARFDYSFDRLAFCYGTQLYYWMDNALTYLGESAALPQTTTTVVSSGVLDVVSLLVGTGVDSGTDTITFSSGSVSGGASVSVISEHRLSPPTKCEVTASVLSLPADGNGTSIVSADVGAPTMMVVFYCRYGTLSSKYAVSNSVGIAQVTYTAGMTIEVDDPVYCICGIFSNSVVIRNTNRVAFSSTAIACADVMIGSASLLTAKVLDSYGNPVENTEIKFEIFTNTSSCTLSGTTATTSSNGICSVTYTSGSSTGIDNVTIDGIHVNIEVYSDYTYPVVPTITQITAGPIYNNGTEYWFEAYLADSSGDAINDVLLSITTTIGDLTVINYNTDDLGKVYFALHSKVPGTSVIYVGDSSVLGALTVSILTENIVKDITVIQTPNGYYGKEIRSYTAFLSDAKGYKCTSSSVSVSVTGSEGAFLAPNATYVYPTYPDPLYRAIDFVWIDGYFVYTDGTSIVATSISDPRVVTPFSYGSSESDPDPILALIKLRGELWVINRNSIEAFQNTGGSNQFPFQRVTGTSVNRGAIGTRMAGVLNQQIIFVGGGRNEPVSLWMLNQSVTLKLSGVEIDYIFTKYTNQQLSEGYLEVRQADGKALVYIHLPDKTLVYYHDLSIATKRPVFTFLHSGLGYTKQYRGRHFTQIENKVLAFDPTSDAHYGFVSSSDCTHWDNVSQWEVTTPVLYNKGLGAFVNSVELLGTVRQGGSVQPKIAIAYSFEGLLYSQNQWINVGKIGELEKRIVWFKQGYFRNKRIMRVHGFTDGPVTITGFACNIESAS